MLLTGLAISAADIGVIYWVDVASDDIDVYMIITGTKNSGLVYFGEL